MYVNHYGSKSIDYIFSNGNVLNFDIDTAAVISRYKDVFSIVNRMLEYNDSFRITYESFLLDYVNSDKRMQVFISYIDRLSKMIDDMFDSMDLTKDLVVKVNKKFVMNIDREEGVAIFRTSIRTRFFIVCYMSQYSLDQYEQKTMQKYICKEILENGVVDKLYNILNGIVFATYPTKSGKKLWDLMSSTDGFNYDSHALKLISSMFYKALPCINADDNPIAYMILLCKNELDWLLRTTFRYNSFNSYIDTSSIIKSNSRIIENEIYFRAIVKDCFLPIENNNTYKMYAIKMRECNVYPIMYNISQPILVKIFDVPIRYMMVDNISLLNLYVHKFLDTYDTSKTNIKKMLMTCPVLSNDSRIFTDEYKEKIQEMLSNREYHRMFDFMTHITLKKILTESITTLYKYRYIDMVTDDEVIIDWSSFIEEYIQFIGNIANGNYSKDFEKELNDISFERADSIE